MRKILAILAFSALPVSALAAGSQDILILKPPVEDSSAVQKTAPASAPAPAASVMPVTAALPTTSFSGVSFENALAESYRRNPALEAARAELRAVDENYAQAMSGYRPRLEGTAAYSHVDQKGDVLDRSSDERTVSLDVVQPLYRGGSTAASVTAADKRILAQRALLRITEQSILLQAVTAYMDVIRDQQIVDLTRHNEKVLSEHLDASRQRFELGDITKTDVSQSESRFSAATAGRVRAEGFYRASQAAFEKIIGLSPKGLKKPSRDIMVPSSLDVAEADAAKNNPNMIYAVHNSEAASATTRAIYGEKLPQVDLTGGLSRVYEPSLLLEDKIDQTSFGVRATVPLYTSGATDARVRQARQTEEQRRMEIISTERSVRQEVIDSWTALEAAKAEMAARSVQTQAAQMALDGVKVETDYGSRSTLDLLDAEQEYLDAQVSYVTAERDKIVAAYRLMAAVGELSPAGLQLETPIYNPDKNFQKVKNKWIGTDIGR